MKVIDLSKQGAISTHAVRFYARKGLLSPQRHPQNGYRMFGRDDLARIARIRSLQALGFTLAEIGKALKDADAGHCPNGWMRSVLERRIVETENELKELQARREKMKVALDRWHHTDGLPQAQVASLQIRANDIRVSSA